MGSAKACSAQGFVGNNGTMTDLGLNFFPAAINGNGQIAADAYDTATNQNQPCC